MKDEKKRIAENKERWKDLFAKFFERFDLKDEKKLANIVREGIFILILVL